MITKKFKTNDRGEAQLATWLPLKEMKAIYAEYEKIVTESKKNGDYIPKFKEYFRSTYIVPKLKK